MCQIHLQKFSNKDKTHLGIVSLFPVWAELVFSGCWLKVVGCTPASGTCGCRDGPATDVNADSFAASRDAFFRRRGAEGAFGSFGLRVLFCFGASVFVAELSAFALALLTLPGFRPGFLFSLTGTTGFVSG